MGNAIHAGGGAVPIQILEASPELPRKRLLIAPNGGAGTYIEVRNKEIDGSPQSFAIPANTIFEVLSQEAASRAWWIYRGAAGAVAVSWFYELEEDVAPEIEPESTEAPGMEDPDKPIRKLLWWRFS